MSILVSIKPKYLNKIFAKEKLIELRTRPVNVETPCTIWLYATSPIMAIEGKAVVEKIEVIKPAILWQKYQYMLGLSEEEFDSYVGDSSQITAIFLTNVECFNESLPLAEIKDVVREFHPPQFYIKLNENQPVHHLFERHANQWGSAC